MKTSKLILSVFAVASMFFSCTRSVDDSKSKLTIQLPSAEQLNKIDQSSLSSAPISQKDVQILSEASSEMDEQRTDQFLPIIPTGYTTTNAAPINCYMVAVKGPEDFMSRSFCGIKDSSGELQKTYTFGPKLGLRPPGSTLELEVAPGDSRQVLIFGLHAVNPADCQDFSKNLEKRMFSYPYLLGSSETMRFEGGKEMTIPVYLKTIADAVRIDDCRFDNEQKSLPVATKVVIAKDQFPYGNLVKPVSAGYTCQPLDIELRAEDDRLGVLTTEFKGEIKARVVGTSQTVNDTSVKLYDSFDICKTAAVGSSATTFTIPAGAPKIRKWGNLDSTTISSADLSIAANAGTTSNIASSGVWQFNFHTDSSDTLMDSTIPNKIKPGECYPVKFVNKNLSGVQTASTISLNVTLKDLNGAIDSNFKIYTYSNQGCSSSGDTTLSSTYMITQAYIKYTSPLAEGKTLKINIGNREHYIRAEPAPTYIPVPTYLELKTKTFIKPGNAISADILVKDQYFFPYMASTSLHIKSNSGLKIGDNSYVVTSSDLTLQTTAATASFFMSADTSTVNTNQSTLSGLDIEIPNTNVKKMVPITIVGSD